MKERERNISLKTLVGYSEDDSFGTPYYANRRTCVRCPKVHEKSWAQQHMPVNPILRRQGKTNPWGLLSSPSGSQISVCRTGLLKDLMSQKSNLNLRRQQISTFGFQEHTHLPILTCLYAWTLPKHIHQSTKKFSFILPTLEMTMVCFGWVV